MINTSAAIHSIPINVFERGNMMFATARADHVAVDYGIAPLAHGAKNSRAAGLIRISG